MTTQEVPELPPLIRRARAACMRSDDGDNLPRWGRMLVRDLADEVERLHKWADGFADAQLKERALAEARIQESAQALTEAAADAQRWRRLLVACRWTGGHWMACVTVDPEGDPKQLYDAERITDFVDGLDLPLEGGRVIKTEIRQR